MATTQLASSADIEEFLDCGLISWLELNLPKPEIFTGYSCLLDGTLLHNMWLTLDADPPNTLSSLVGLDGSELCGIRTKNFAAIVENVQKFYFSELQQIIVQLPDCVAIGFSPETKQGLDNMKLLITLILGAAVQCAKKEEFIERIKQLDVPIQFDIVQIIKRVTDEHKLVIAKEALFATSMDNLYETLICLQQGRNAYYTKWIDSEVTGAKPIFEVSFDTSGGILNEKIDDLTAKARKLHQELAEKSDTLLDLKSELDQTTTTLEKLQSDSREWYMEAQRAVAYRDELDALREEAEKVDTMKIEIQKLREKLTAAEYYKIRFEELQNDNSVLLDTKSALEAQLKVAREKYAQLKLVESHAKVLQHKLDEIILERGMEREKNQELIEENTQLRLSSQQEGVSKPSSNKFESEPNGIIFNTCLSDQIKDSLQPKLSALELENSRLLALIEDKEGAPSVQCSAMQTSIGEANTVHIRRGIHRSTGEQNKLKATSQDISNNSVVISLQNPSQSQPTTTDIIKASLNTIGTITLKLQEEDTATGDHLVIKCFKTSEAYTRFMQSHEIPMEVKEIGGITIDERAMHGNIPALVSKISGLELKVNTLQKQNNQLTSAKESLTERIESLKQGHKIICRDQNRLRRQYERLIEDYQSVSKDRALLKQLVCDIQEENDDIKNRSTRLEKTTMEELAALKAEHSKLTEDFYELFGTCEQYRNNYESLRLDHEATLNENEILKRQISELGTRIESIVNVENDYSSLVDRCDMLLSMNVNLTKERRILMDNVSQLLGQYHELMSHSLEDKQHYYEAQQEYLDQVSVLNRQKERLEIKIMDQFKTVDSSSKKKESSLIKRMKQASCDFISKVPTRSRKPWAEESSATPSKIQLNDSESVSPCSELTSESPQSSRAQLGMQLNQDGVPTVEDIEYDEKNDGRFYVGSFESSGEPLNNLDCLEPGYRKPIYSHVDEGKR